MNPKYLKIISRGIAMLLPMALLLAAAVPVMAAPGDTTRVSVDSLGGEGNAMSRWSAISSDGRYVAFESDASDLVDGDTNGASDIFVHDRQTGATTRESVASDGTQANGGSNQPAISADGRYVAFISDATNLVDGDTNGMTDVFVHDRQTGLTTRASVSSSGEQANDNSDSRVSISSDGRFVAYLSNATNLVTGDANGFTDVFVHDNQAGSTERVSLANDGTEANAGFIEPAISADGRFVVFSSSATNLVSGDTNGSMDVFVRDRQAGTTTRVSVNSSGVEANKGARDSSISGDGRYMAFSSSSTNLMDQDTQDFEYIYVHDSQTGSTTNASVDSQGNLMYGWSEMPSISSDGRYVAFTFDDKGDGLAITTVHVHDLLTGMTIGASHGSDSAFTSSISADGHFVAYVSASNNVVAGDTNGVNDVFLYETNFGPDLSPTVQSIHPICGGTCSYPSPQNISFTVVFSEAVTGVTVDDFALNTTGNISSASVLSVSGSWSTYTVTVNTGTGDGSLRLDVIDNDSIKDISSNPLGGAGADNGNFNTGEPYLVDRNFPVVTGIVRVDPTPTTADTVHFTVTFSEEVAGVDAADFALTTTGSIAGAAITAVDGLRDTYSVTVSTGTGDGTLRLDLIDNQSITDAVSNPLGGAGAGNGDFTTGETYTINRSTPLVTSSLRVDPDPTTADSVHFNVTFSEAVSGVDASDFVLTISGGVTGAALTDVTGSGSLYTVTVTTGTGNGTIRLDVLDNDSIVDEFGTPLGGVGAGNGNFTTGDAYTVARPVVIETGYFRSNGTNDGWILESGENSNVGGDANVIAPTFNLGDDLLNRQYRAILHFPTYYLPDNAVVTQVILLLKAQGVVGTDPFTTHQNIQVDINKGLLGYNGPFGLFSLQPSDFEATTSRDAVGVIPNSPVAGWYWSMLDSSAFQYINLTGVTQFRLEFQLDDNNDLGNDYLTFFSGNYNVVGDRPQLWVQYYVPK